MKSLQLNSVLKNKPDNSRKRPGDPLPSRKTIGSEVKAFKSELVALFHYKNYPHVANGNGNGNEKKQYNDFFVFGLRGLDRWDYRLYPSLGELKPGEKCFLADLSRLRHYSDHLFFDSESEKAGKVPKQLSAGLNGHTKEFLLRCGYASKITEDPRDLEDWHGVQKVFAVKKNGAGLERVDLENCVCVRYDASKTHPENVLDALQRAVAAL